MNTASGSNDTDDKNRRRNARFALKLLAQQVNEWHQEAHENRLLAKRITIIFTLSSPLAIGIFAYWH